MQSTLATSIRMIRLVWCLLSTQVILVTCNQTLHLAVPQLSTQSNPLNETSREMLTVHGIYPRNFRLNVTSGRILTIYAKYLSNFCSNSTSDEMSTIHAKYTSNFRSNAISDMRATVHAKCNRRCRSNALSGVASTIQRDYVCTFSTDGTNGTACTIHEVSGSLYRVKYICLHNSGTKTSHTKWHHTIKWQHAKNTFEICKKREMNNEQRQHSVTRWSM